MRTRLYKHPLIVAISLLSTCVAGFAAPAVASESAPTIVVLGDSLSAGFGLDLQDTWVALLQKRLEEKGYGYRVINASISGDTTGNGLRRIPRTLDIHQPEIVIIELGGNDGLRGLPIKVMRDNFSKMIRLSIDQGSTVVLAGILIPPNYGQEYATEFAELYPSLADEYQLPLIPFFMEDVALDPGKMQADGIHPNKSAQPLLLENVWAVLSPVLETS
jgi:acyl-CoA thioesterase-1